MLRSIIGEQVGIYEIHSRF